MRAGIQTRPAALRTLDRFNHRAGRALAIGAGHVETRGATLRVPEALGQRAHTVDAETRTEVTQSRQPAQCGGRFHIGREPLGRATLAALRRAVSQGPEQAR